MGPVFEYLPGQLKCEDCIYYGGREDYSYWVCDLKKLHEALTERNLI